MGEPGYWVRERIPQDYTPQTKQHECVDAGYFDDLTGTPDPYPKRRFEIFVYDWPPVYLCEGNVLVGRIAQDFRSSPFKDIGELFRIEKRKHSNTSVRNTAMVASMDNIQQNKLIAIGNVCGVAQRLVSQSSGAPGGDRRHQDSNVCATRGMKPPLLEIVPDDLPAFHDEFHAVQLSNVRQRVARDRN